MPSRGGAAGPGAAMGKKTLSDSEVLAYSKNRFVEHGLRQLVQQLSDQEQVCQDLHQKEMVRWKHFIRQSSRTTGVWATWLGDDHHEVQGDEEEEEGGQQQQQQQDPQEASCQQQGEDPPAQRGPPSPRAPTITTTTAAAAAGASNPSTEMARSLMFQNEALNQLQKPWLYSYSEASYNTVSKDALQVSRVKEKRLLFKRAVSATAPRPLSRAPSFRAPSTRGERSRAGGTTGGGSRPLTGRSTPGVMPKRSPDRLTAAVAAVKKGRPKTSLGVVRAEFHRPQKVAWTDAGQTRGDDSQCRLNQTDEDGKTGQSSPDVALPTDSVASQHVTTVYQFGDSGESVEVSRSKENPPKNVKLPTIKKRKYGVVAANIEQLLGKMSVEDSARGTVEATDAIDGGPNQVNEQLTQHTTEQENPQVRDEQSDQQRGEGQSDGEATSQANSTSAQQTVAESRDRREAGGTTGRVQRWVAVWKRKTIRRTSDGSETSGLKAAESRPLVTLPRDGSFTVRQGAKDGPVTAAPPTTEASPPALSQSESSVDNHEDYPHNSRSQEDQRHNLASQGDQNNISKNQQAKQGKAESQETMPNKPEGQEDKQHNSNTSNSRSSDLRFKPAGSSHRRGGASEQHVSGIHSVKRRGSFMKIVDQLVAFREGNRRRSDPEDDNADTLSDDKETVSKPDDKPTPNVTNDTPTTERNVPKGKSRHRCGKLTAAMSILKSSPDDQTNNKPASSQQSDKTEEASHTTSKPASTSPPSHPNEAQSLILEEGPDTSMVEHQPENVHPPHPKDAVGGPPSSPPASEAGCTTFRGYRIRNYVRPQLRYLADPFLSSRREKSLLRLSIEYPLYLNGYRGDMKSQMRFPKTCRQKVLQELVQRNHQPLPAHAGGEVTAELKAKIDDFFKTLEHHCPKPGIILDQ